MPPAVHVAAITRQFALHQLGNASWEVVFGEVLPEVRVPHTTVCVRVKRWRRVLRSCARPRVLAHPQTRLSIEHLVIILCWKGRLLMLPGACDQAARHVRKVLSLPHDDSIATVQFGHNSHELIFRSGSRHLQRAGSCCNLYGGSLGCHSRAHPT